MGYLYSKFSQKRMIISYQWLLEYLPKPVPVGDLSDILTSIGLEVEAVEPVEAVKGSLEGLVIGEVLTCEKHPNADKLKITTVSIASGEPLKIVCGAPNVAAGQRVIVAPVGTTVYPTEGESFLIKRAKIRGEESEGMICADDEIGLSKDHSGIKILPEDAPVGTLAKTYFNIPEADHAIHIGLTPNRSDAMSHIGVAKDVCAYLTHHAGSKHSVQLPDIKLPAKSDNLDINVTIEATEACPRYTGITLTDIKVGPSPEWLQQRLRAIGSRPINNVVDITNFVLHEYGQPLHAFNAEEITGSKIAVRFEKDGSKFTTLDEKERTLLSSDLMICNDSEGMCIAGVFGGLRSGVSDSTTKIFLESAYFTPSFIRRTSLHHGLRTDAATHFEKGVDINLVDIALKRAATMIVELCGAKIASDVIDVYAKKPDVVTINTSYEHINKLAGKQYSKDSVKEILSALGFGISNETNEAFTVAVPGNKHDVLQQADIVEEILRIDGLNNVAIPDRLNISLSRPWPNDRKDREKLANMLSGNGFSEIVTNSIVNSKYYPEREDLVRMLNSLSSELDVMRPSMLESGLEVIQYNYNRKSQDLLLYEFGNVYTQKAQGNYNQETQLAIWVTGNAQHGNWQQKAAKADMYFLKSVLNNLMSLSGINTSCVYGADGSVEWKWKNQSIAIAMQVDGRRLSAFDIKQDVFFASINWDVWLAAAATSTIRYKEVPKFPAVQRDLAIVLDKSVSYQQVQQVTEQLKLDGLKEFGLFDIFESEKLGAGKKSYALNYTFQFQDRTLTDTEIEQLMQQLVTAYKTKLQAQIRE
jgi:phenylalanyl-tRNA synthetase beta chain